MGIKRIRKIIRISLEDERVGHFIRKLFLNRGVIKAGRCTIIPKKESDLEYGCGEYLIEFLREEDYSTFRKGEDWNIEEGDIPKV